VADVDEALLANGIDYVRYNDDYRIFATSYTESYRHIAFLADILYRNHGLSLQPQKTGIFTEERFRERFLITPAEREINSLHDRFENINSRMRIANIQGVSYGSTYGWENSQKLLFYLIRKFRHG